LAAATVAPLVAQPRHVRTSDAELASYLAAVANGEDPDGIAADGQQQPQVIQQPQAQHVQQQPQTIQQPQVQYVQQQPQVTQQQQAQSIANETLWTGGLSQSQPTAPPGLEGTGALQSSVVFASGGELGWGVPPGASQGTGLPQGVAAVSLAASATGLSQGVAAVSLAASTFGGVPDFAAPPLYRRLRRCRADAVH